MNFKHELVNKELVTKTSKFLEEAALQRICWPEMASMVVRSWLYDLSIYIMWATPEAQSAQKFERKWQHAMIYKTGNITSFENRRYATSNPNLL